MSSRRQELVAEFAVLDLYDQLREHAGHDYGSGQRAAELRRRRRFLEDRGAGELLVPDLYLELEPHELVDAFARVGLPRLHRAEREPGYTQGTPSGQRTVWTWRQVHRVLVSRTTADARLKEARA